VVARQIDIFELGFAEIRPRDIGITEIAPFRSASAKTARPSSAFERTAFSRFALHDPSQTHGIVPGALVDLQRERRYLGNPHLK